MLYFIFYIENIGPRFKKEVW